MSEIFAKYALEWLEQKLLPIALAAANLAPETTLADLQAMNLTLPKGEDYKYYDHSESGVLCSKRVLFASALLAMELSPGEQAKAIARSIFALMWRDGVEFAQARDLDMACNLGELTDIEFANRCDDAVAQWDRWVATDQAVLLSTQEFLCECADEKICWSGEPFPEFG